MSLPDYVIGAELPDWALFIQLGGAWVDMSSGWTFEVKVAPQGSTTASFTKTTGITGTVGTSPNITNPVPSATVSWATSAELSTLTAGPYVAQFRARRTSDSRDVFLTEPFKVLAAIA